MRFSDTFLDEVVARNDIADVVSSYVTLTRKGSNLFGLCPFHNEKTPSFSVAPDKQIYHCFGCKKGGSVINFIMEIEGLSFPEAVAFLAKRANLPLPAEEEQTGADRMRRRVLEQLLYHLGRWIYLVDAADDLKKDVKSGSYNPLVYRFHAEGGTLTAEDRAALAATLDSSVRAMAAAFELADFGPWRAIIESVVYEGLYAVGAAVLNGTFRKGHRRKQRKAGA